jgi:hypothetical protein
LGYSLSEVIIISVDISSRRNIPVRNQSGLRLLSLALLASLLSGLLLLHLLVAQGSQRASNLLDLIARKVLGQLLGELLQEDHVLSLLGVVTDDWDEGVAHLLELELGLGVEEREGGKVDGGVGVLRVNYDSVRGSSDLAVVADTDVGKKVLRVLQVRLLLRSSQSLSSGSLILLTAVFITLLCESSCLLGLLLCDALGLGFLVCLLLRLSLGLSLCRDLGLLALDFRILCRGPAV